MKATRSITTKLDLGDGYVSYEQTRPNGKRIVTLRLNGKPMGCLSNPMVNHQVAAQMLLQMAKHDASEQAKTVEATVSDAAAQWNDQQLAAN